MTDSANEAIWRVVAAIPPGRVLSYGEVARRAGLPRAARRVGRALKAAPASLALPWHRVVRADGRIAFPRASAHHREQAARLRAEGLQVTRGRVRARPGRDKASLDRLLWGGEA